MSHTPSQCAFVPLRKNRPRCDQESETDFNFCRRHLVTVQALAKQNGLQERNDQEDNSKEREDNLKRGYKKVEITKNHLGNFEHRPSGLVFDPQSRKAIGHQSYSNGAVYPLTEEDIKLCRNNRWDYGQETLLSAQQTSVPFSSSDILNPSGPQVPPDRGSDPLASCSHCQDHSQCPTSES